MSLSPIKAIHIPIIQSPKADSYIFPIHFSLFSFPISQSYKQFSFSTLSIPNPFTLCLYPFPISLHLLQFYSSLYVSIHSNFSPPSTLSIRLFPISAPVLNLISNSLYVSMSLLYQFQFLSTFYYSMSLSNFCPCSQFNFHRFTPSVPHLTHRPTASPTHDSPTVLTSHPPTAVRRLTPSPHPQPQLQRHTNTTQPSSLTNHRFTESKIFYLSERKRASNEAINGVKSSNRSTEFTEPWRVKSSSNHR